MPLRDTLNRLREQGKQEISDRPTLIAEWKSAVDALLMEIRKYLDEYVQDGSLSIKLRRVRFTEDSLGTYEIGAMDIQAGPIFIIVQPVGRFVAGAEGRVDMHRQGRSAEQHRIMLLHMQLSGPAHPPTWYIQFPPDITNRLDPLHPPIPGTRRVMPLTKKELEEAVEFLLK